MAAQGSFKRLVSKGVFPHQWAFSLLIPLRSIFLSRKNLVRRLELREDCRVMELGPGPGFFSIAVAKKLQEGELVLADIQQEMLDYAKRRIDRKKLKNVEYYLCNGINFNFPDQVFDRIFMVTVIGEVENKEAYISEFYRMLKSGGILSISEQAGDPDKMTQEEIQELAQRSLFRLHHIYGSKRNFTINFQK